MSDYRVKMEQYFQDHKNYGTTAAGACANGTNAPSWNDFVPKGANKYFDFSCVTSVTGYVLTATGKAGKATAGHVYITSTEPNVGDRQRTTMFKGAAVDKSCWLVKGSEC
jgi:type IV pilus assembly protein PilE